MLRQDADAPWRAETAGFDPSQPPPAMPGPPRDRWRWWKRGLYAAFAILALLFLWLLFTAPLSKSLRPIAPPAITLLSADGRPIARRGAITDDPVDVAKLPAHVPGAFLAIEDRRFRSHWGVDPRGIARAAWANLQAGGVREGGSTITQQLAKLVFLSSDRTAGRKVQEMILAFWLEAWLSKDEILSRYLSSVYFGDNVYGLRAAAQHYFSRDPEDLTIGEAAMLAGLVKAPSRLAPTRNLAGARERAALVVAAMGDTGVIGPREAARATPARLRVRRAAELPTGTYFADWAFPQARAAAEAGYGEQSVTTTLDDDIQRQAVAAVRRARLGGAQVALVAMRPDGRVVAMIGGRSYRDSPFNRAVQAKRQPGSTFKLFVYLAALRAGVDPQSLVEDRPLTIAGWSPKNNSGRYRGLIPVREAFAISSNVAAVRLQEEVGRDKVIRAARDLGITAPLPGDATLALGTADVPLIQMVAAYAAMAQGRYPVVPHALPDAPGQGWFANMRAMIRGFRERDVRPRMLDLLWAAANEGTGRAAALPIDTFGKTGTSQDHRDAIFIGFAGDLVTGVWIGKDDNSPLKGVEGGGLPARIWRDFMSRAVAGGAPRARPVVRTEPREAAEDSGARIDVPVGETGLSIGVDIGPDGVSLSGAEDEPAPAEEEERPEPDFTVPPPEEDVPEPVLEER